MTQQTKKNKGLALVQVLLLVAMLSILLLLMTANTQQQQKQVIALQAQLDQHFRLYSTGNDMLYSLLTHSWNRSAQASASGSAILQSAANESGGVNAWHEHWNFYASSFSLNDYSARITNLNSLVSIQSPGRPMVLLLKHLGYAEAEAISLANQVPTPFATTSSFGPMQLPSEQSQQEDFLPLQHTHELSLLPGWDKELMQRVAPYVTTYSSGFVNEAYLPNTMLEMMVSKSQADIIRLMRAEGTFNSIQFEAVTEMLENELRRFFVGPDFRIEVWHNSSPYFVRVLEVRLLPYQPTAVEFRYQGWGY